jgi:hypothetical protein
VIARDSDRLYPLFTRVNQSAADARRAARSQSGGLINFDVVNIPQLPMKASALAAFHAALKVGDLVDGTDRDGQLYMAQVREVFADRAAVVKVHFDGVRLSCSDLPVCWPPH